MRLSIDLETYCDVDLTKMGVYRYVDSPYFKILLFAYSIDGGDVRLIDFNHGELIPDEVLAMLTDRDVVKSAFNAQFERVCLDKYTGKKTGPWECTMVKAWSCGINGGLASVGAAIGLPEEQQKLKEGKRLIKKFSVPQKKVQTSLLNDEDWQKFKDYCKRDVEVELKIAQKLDKFPVPEWEKDLYDLDQLINDRGIKLDLDMVKNAIAIDKELASSAKRRYKEITGLDNPNSLVDIKAFIKKETGDDLKSITKSNLYELMDKYNNYSKVVEVLKIRALLSKTSTAKYHMMQEVALSDGRSRGNIQYYGANRTGRWAGRLIQVHNLPRNHISDLDTVRDAVKHTDYEGLAMLYDDPSDILSQCLRTAIIPEEGKKFIVADFSAIEARVIAWFAGEDWVLESFRRGEDIYCSTASQMFGVPVEKHGINGELRQKGKVATLACGYQGSVGALKAMGALEMGLQEEELQSIVDSWRKANPNIVKFWHTTQWAITKTIDKGGVEIFQNGKLKSFIKSGILWIELPSGRRLAYARPRFSLGSGSTVPKIVFYDRNSAGTDWVERDTYGGKLVENIVQATARDCLAFSMLALEREGYKIVMHVHDEVIIEIDRDSDELDKICEIMGRELPWARGLPLSADGYECDFYKKD